MSDLPSMPPPLSPGKQLALEAGLQLIGVAGFAAMCGLAWLLWRSLKGGGGGGTPKRRRVDEAPDPHATPPAHEERREAHVFVHRSDGVREVIATGPASRPPFIVPGEGQA